MNWNGRRGQRRVTEAERRNQERLKKQRQRRGETMLYVPVHLPSLVSLLLAEGLITDKDIENRDAVAEAAGVHLRNHQHVGRLLKAKPTPPNWWELKERLWLPPPWHPIEGSSRPGLK